MIRFICCIGLFFLLADTSATKFTDCGSSGSVSKVEVSDCPDSSDICPLKRNTKKSLTIVFQSKSESNKVTAEVHGVIHSVPLPFPLPHDKADGCKTGITCPMKNGETYNYVNTMDIKPSYPPMEVTVRWELKDDNSEDIVCVEIPSKIE